MEIAEGKISFRNSRYLFYAACAVVIIALGALVYFSLVKPMPCFTGRYVQLDYPLLQLFFVLPGPVMVMLFICILNPPADLYEDRLVKLNWFSKAETFYLDDMTGWKLGNYKGRQSIRLYFPQGYVLLNDSSKVPELVERLARYPKYDGTAPNAIRGLIIFMIALSIYLIGVVFMTSYPLRGNWKGSDTIAIQKAVLDRGPAEVWHHSKNSSWRDIRFTILGQPGYVYVVRDEMVMRPHADQWLAHSGTHDTLDLWMLKYDYDVKIAGSREPGFFDKHYRWYEIQVTDLNFENQQP